MSESNEMTENQTPIYSRWAVIGFCVFFSPLFGGFLLRQNLKENGNGLAGSLVLLVSLGMVLNSAWVLQTKWAGPGVNFALNLLQGALLTEFVFRRYFPDSDQRPTKSLLKPLLVSLVFVFLALAFILSQNPGSAQ